MAEVIRITGGVPLSGTIRIQGSKNAALPVLAASLLHRGETVLHNCPDIADVENMLRILEHLRCTVRRDGHTVTVDAANAVFSPIDEDCAGNMRGLVLFLGSMLGRFSEAKLPYPGGCVIGARPIDLHLAGLAALGVSVAEECGGVTAKGVPEGGTAVLSARSVGATENLLLASAGAKNPTVLDGCATEPEIAALCRYLVCIGVRVEEIGGARLSVKPIRDVPQKRVEYTIPGDRIVAGTCALAAIGCGGSIAIDGVSPADLRGQREVLAALGAQLSYQPKQCRLHVRAPEKIHAVSYTETAPYPGFPTDLQSQLLAVLAVAEGESTVAEKIFEQRFKIVEPLVQMGADITADGSRAIVRGVERLHGARVEAKELRGGAGLVIAGMMAEGESVIGGVRYLRRGYENICRDFQTLGAHIALARE